MTLTKEQSGTTLTIALKGNLDVNTAPQLQEELNHALDGVTELVLDLSGLGYISSGGLRVLLDAQKTMKMQGSLKLIHVGETVRETLNITGFSDVLTIE